MTGRVVVIGAINVDSVLAVARLPDPGETVFADSEQIGFGGKGGNQAVASARLSTPTLMIANVGDDSFGHAAIEDLRKEGVDVSGVRVDKAHLTGRAIVLLRTDGENSIVLTPGANRTLSATHVAESLLSVSLTSSDVVLVSAEVPEECAEAAAVACQRSGARLVYNLAPFRPLGAWTATHRPFLILNDVEAAQASGVGEPSRALKVLESVSRGVIVTRGERGAVISGDSIPETGIVAAAAVAVDTTGAGDAFCGAYTASLAGGLRPVDAVRRAVRAGTFAISKVGARGALPYAQDIEPLTRLSQRAWSE